MLIYINGYWNRVTGIFGLSPGTSLESYWNHFSPVFISASCEFMGSEDDEPRNFIDGSSLFGIDQLAPERFMNGSKYAYEHFNELTGSLKPGEIFKFVSHSEGGAFAAGMADLLVSTGYKVEKMLYLSPREGDDFFSPHSVFAIQAHYINDPICAAKRVKGVDIFINLLKLDGKKVGLLYAHGGTVKASAIGILQQVLDMLPHNGNNKMVEGHWTVTETEEGFIFVREVDLISEKE